MIWPHKICCLSLYRQFFKEEIMHISRFRWFKKNSDHVTVTWEARAFKKWKISYKNYIFVEIQSDGPIKF